jgi:four helix bundle suffix protein
VSNSRGYLLKNQIKSLEEAFVNEGGLREKMTKVRIDHRNSNSNQGN